MADPQAITFGDEKGNPLDLSPVTFGDEKGNPLFTSPSLSPTPQGPQSQSAGTMSLEPTAPTMGKMASDVVGGLPAIGMAFGGFPGAGLGAAVKGFIQPEEGLRGVGSDILQNGVIPTAVERLIAGNPITKFLASKTLAALSPGLRAGLEESAKAANSTGQEMADRFAQSQIKSQAGKYLNPLGDATPIRDTSTSVPKSKIAMVVNPEDQTISDAFKSGTTKGTITNIDKIRKGIQDETVSKGRQKEVNDFLDSIPSTPSKATSGSDSLLDNWKGRVLLRTGASTLGAVTPLGPAAHTAVGGLILGDQALEALSKNPKIYRMIKEARDLPVDSSKSALFRAGILAQLKGKEVYSLDSDGNEEKARVSDQGVPQTIR